MSSASVQRLHRQNKPTKTGRPVKYKHNEFRNRRKLLRLGFPGTIKEAIEQEKPSVVAWARHYYFSKNTGFLSMDDLIHFGEIGVGKAYVRFRYNMGWKFTTFANWWIKAEIERNVELENRSMVSIGADELYVTYKKAYEAYTAGEKPDSLNQRGKEIYEKLKTGKLTPERAQDWLTKRKLAISNASNLLSLNQLIDASDSKSRTKLDMVSSPYENINETSVDYELIMERIQLHAYSIIDSGKVFKTIKTRTRATVIFEQRCFRYDGDKKAKLVEIADWFGVTRERIRQIEEKLMKNLMPRLLSDPVIQEAASAYLNKE